MTGVSHRLLKIVPNSIHPVADQGVIFAFQQPAVRRIADDGQNRLLGLDPIGLAPLVGNSFDTNPSGPAGAAAPGSAKVSAK